MKCSKQLFGNINNIQFYNSIQFDNSRESPPTSAKVKGRVSA